MALASVFGVADATHPASVNAAELSKPPIVHQAVNATVDPLGQVVSVTTVGKTVAPNGFGYPSFVFGSAIGVTSSASSFGRCLFSNCTLPGTIVITNQSNASLTSSAFVFSTATFTTAVLNSAEISAAIGLPGHHLFLQNATDATCTRTTLSACANATGAHVTSTGGLTLLILVPNTAISAIPINTIATALNTATGHTADLPPSALAKVTEACTGVSNTGCVSPTTQFIKTEGAAFNAPQTDTAGLRVRDVTATGLDPSGISPTAFVVPNSGLISTGHDPLGPPVPNSAIPLSRGCNAISGMVAVSTSELYARVQPSSLLVATWEHHAATNSLQKTYWNVRSTTQPPAAMTPLLACVSGSANLN